MIDLIVARRGDFRQRGLTRNVRIASGFEVAELGSESQVVSEFMSEESPLPLPMH